MKEVTLGQLLDHPNPEIRLEANWLLKKLEIINLKEQLRPLVQRKDREPYLVVSPSR